MQEYIDILTEEGIATGKKLLKTEAHRLGLWHASAQIWIINSNKEVLIQKRAANKDSYPNLWDISVAGHLSAGDTPKQAAVREIAEEIGLKITAKELQFFKTIKKSKTPKSNFIDNEFNYLFGLKKDFELNEITLQKEEVAAVKWIKIKEFENQLQEIPEIYVPHGDKYYKYIISQINQI